MRTYNSTDMEKENKKGYTAQHEQIARFTKAMGHPARIAILSFLASQDSCFFGDIHDELPIAKATVSQHLNELKDEWIQQRKLSCYLSVKPFFIVSLFLYPSLNF